MEYFLIEQAMLRGASIAFQSILEKEAIDNEKLYGNISKTLNNKNKPIQITTKNGLLYINNEMIPLPEADMLARNHNYLCAEQMVRALEKKKWNNRELKISDWLG